MVFSGLGLGSRQVASRFVAKNKRLIEVTNGFDAYFTKPTSGPRHFASSEVSGRRIAVKQSAVSVIKYGRT